VSDLLIFTVVAGAYRDYAPLFQKSIEIQYPEYDHAVSEMDFPPEDGVLAASMRFLTEPPGDHKYCYATDVDMFIIREDQPLINFHLDEIGKSGLCYSNSRRRKEKRGSDRLTGLHFVERRPWYDATKERREYWLEKVIHGKYGKGPFEDEILLQDLVVESGLNLCGNTHLASRHHGIHLLFKHYRNHSRATIKQQLLMRISPVMAQRYIQNFDDSEWVKLEAEAKTKSDRLRYELDVIYSFCRKREKQVETWKKYVASQQNI